MKHIEHVAMYVNNLEMTTFDESLCKIVEPGVSTTKERFEALLKFKEAGIPTVVWLIVCSISLFFILGVIASLQLTRISDGFGTLAAFCSSLVIVYSVKSIISVKKLTDKVNKSQVNKIFIMLIAVGIIILIMTILLILWAVS